MTNSIIIKTNSVDVLIDAIKKFPFNEGKPVAVDRRCTEFYEAGNLITEWIPRFVNQYKNFIIEGVTLETKEYYPFNEIQVDTIHLDDIPDLIPGYLGENPKEVPNGYGDYDPFFEEILSSKKEIRFFDFLGRPIPVYQEEALLDWEGNLRFGYWSETDNHINIYVKSVESSSQPNQNRVFRHAIGFLRDETRSDVVMLDDLLHIGKECEICCCSHDQWVYSKNHIWVEISGVPTRSFDQNVYSKIGRDGKRHVRKNNWWVKNAEEKFTHHERKEGSKINYLFNEIFVKEVVINKVIARDKTRAITNWCDLNGIKLEEAPIDSLNIGSM